MLIASIIVFTFLIFPIFINLDIFFSKYNRKIFFQIKLFKIIKILSGYATLEKDGIAIHVKNNKAIIIPFTDFFSFRTKIKPLKDLHIYNINLNFGIGVSQREITCFSLGFICSFMSNIIGKIIYEEKPYITFNTNYLFFNNKEYYAYGNISVVFNILVVFISLIKVLMEKILLWKKKTI